jgi:DNA-binding SARP family transcriptional activator
MGIAVDHGPQMLPPRNHDISAAFPLGSAAGLRPTRIQLCGRLRVDIEGRHVTPLLRGRQGRVLLAYLVVNRNRAISREEMIQAIWPNQPPVDPAAALRTQLSRVRTALGAHALAGRDAIELRLPEGTWIDVEVAEEAMLAANAALDDQDWGEAWMRAHITINIAGRPFVAGFDAPWAREVRADLKELELRAMEAIARAGIGLGGSELAGAERAAQALIRAAPFRESGYVQLMRALIAAGNSAEALRTYDQLRTLLASELGSAPGAEAQALHRELLGGQ